MNEKLYEDLKEIYKRLSKVNEEVPKELGYEPTPTEVRELDRAVTEQHGKLESLETDIAGIIGKISAGEYDST